MTVWQRVGLFVTTSPTTHLHCHTDVTGTLRRASSRSAEPLLWSPTVAYCCKATFLRSLSSCVHYHSAKQLLHAGRREQSLSNISRLTDSDRVVFSSAERHNGQSTTSSRRTVFSDVLYCHRNLQSGRRDTLSRFVWPSRQTVVKTANHVHGCVKSVCGSLHW